MVYINRAFQALAIASFAVADDAPVKTNSPESAKYIAKFSDNIEGSVVFSTTSNSTVKVDVDFDGLPSSGGPFAYHVHVVQVPSDGNCTATLGHLNPYDGSVNATSPAAKEVGDLSGKHGVIDDQSYQTSYIDEYISLEETDPAFVGNRSVVVHFANNTRLACANITEYSVSSNSSSNSSSSSSSNSSSNSSNSTLTSGNAAVVNYGNAPVLLGAVAAAVGLLI